MSKKAKNKILSAAEAEEIQMKLKNCAEQVNQLHTEIAINDALSLNYSKVAKEQAIKAGGLLNEVKKLVKYGTWETWVAENFPHISKRTVENYMKLAKNASEAQMSALVNDADSLYEAYIRVGIYNEKAKPEGVSQGDPTPGITTPGNTPADNTTPATTPGQSTPGSDTVPPAVAPTTTTEAAKPTVKPEKLKETDRAAYTAIFKEARNSMRSFVHEKITNEKRINWSLSTWKVKDHKPCSADEANYGAALFSQLQEWAAKREFPSITNEDEVSTKVGIILSKLMGILISANTATHNDAPTLAGLMNIDPEYSMEINRHGVEVPAETPA